ncbi:MAG: DNA-entry nuclease, partial [Clostridia bacterium]|nr:DNA-entry nuclease [Clostridia bacterium]
EPEPEPEPEPQVPAKPTGTKYILNTSSKKYHYTSCYQVKRIAAKNYSEYTGTAAELKSMGYTACGTCH